MFPEQIRNTDKLRSRRYNASPQADPAERRDRKETKAMAPRALQRETSWPLVESSDRIKLTTFQCSASGDRRSLIHFRVESGISSQQNVASASSRALSSSSSASCIAGWADGFE